MSSSAAKDVAESLVDAISDLDGASIEHAVLRCKMEHELVEEVFADERAITEALRRVTPAGPHE